jgi:signal transduction histidine kinase
LSEETLFGFLRSTRLPVVAGVSTWIRWLSLGCALGSLVFAGIVLVTSEDPWWSAAAPWSGALPALLAAPCFLAAWHDWRRQRLQRAATLLFVAMFVWLVLASWPRGSLSPTWYLHPVLCLAAATSLGVTPGLVLAAAATTLLLLAAWWDPAATTASAADRWVHTTCLAAVSLASALTGAIVNRLVLLALLTAEAQRRKNFESSRALRHREKLLRHALRVETIGDLAGMVCHQLRNTFQVLLGHASLGHVADDAERAHRLALIEQTVEQAKPLLDQLLRMAHPDEGSPVATDVAAALRQFAAQAQTVLPSSIRLELEAPDALPPVLLDQHALAHALWNLVINARQAITGDGQIRLRCGHERQQVWIEVVDSGGGMTAEVQRRIFDPYFTTKPRGEGTGLGLTAVARFVRGSNGQIQVESEVGRGSTFRLRFPTAEVSGAARSA